MRVLLVVQLIILLTAFSFSAEQDTKSIIVTQTNDSLDKALPPILSEETRKKIRAEEIFREEVKKTLVKKKGVTVEELANSVQQAKKENVVKVIRWLLDAGKLYYEGDILKWRTL